MSIKRFISSMLSEDSKVSHKRVIVFGTFAVFILLIVPANLFFKLHVDDNIMSTITLVIVGGMGASAAVSISSYIAAAKGTTPVADTTVTTETNITTNGGAEQPAQ